MQDQTILFRSCNVHQYFPLKKTKVFQKMPQFIKANDGITLDIYRGETLGLVGESGCGKSTFGRTLLHLYPPTEGKVLYYGRTLKEFRPHYAASEPQQEEGIDLSRLKREELRLLRKDMQMIFQDPYSSLNPRMSAGQILTESLLAHGLYKPGSPELAAFVSQIMEECGLAPYFVHRFPHQFSGGQRQRVAIARALAVRPKFVVCDEAVSALDVSIQSQILNLLQDLKEQQGLTYLFISHDLSVVKYISDRIGVMYLGNLVELAPTAELFAAPTHPYTQALLAAIPTLDSAAPHSLPLLEGEMPSTVNPPAGCKFHTRCPHATDLCRTVAPTWGQVTPSHFVACHHKGRVHNCERQEG